MEGPYTRYMKRFMHRGQVLLITVLVLSIGVTIALSLIGRGVTDVSMSRNLEESARAFSAAEAGIEEALRTGTVITEARVYVPGVKYQSSVLDIGGTTGSYTLPTTGVGQVESVWLVDHATGTNTIDETKPYTGTSINVCWTPPSTPGGAVPAVEIALYYKVGGAYLVQRGAYDPDSVARPSNNFSAVTQINGSCGTVANVYRQSIAIPAGTPLLLRIRPFYAATTITVAPVGADIILPKQGTEITSTGTTDGGVSRKIVVKRQYPWPAGIFDYGVYSQDSFVH